MEQTRRSFLVHAGRLLVVLPLGFATTEHALGCGGGDECGGANTVDENDAQLIYTSSCAGSGGGHVHMFTVDKVSLTTPPAGGLSGDTTPYDDDGHVHSVSLTAADLAAIDSGSTITKTTSVDVGHSHAFEFRKATA